MLHIIGGNKCERTMRRINFPCVCVFRCVFPNIFEFVNTLANIKKHIDSLMFPNLTIGDAMFLRHGGLHVFAMLFTISNVWPMYYRARMWSIMIFVFSKRLKTFEHTWSRV